MPDTRTENLKPRGTSKLFFWTLQDRAFEPRACTLDKCLMGSRASDPPLRHTGRPQYHSRQAASKAGRDSPQQRQGSRWRPPRAAHPRRERSEGLSGYLPKARRITTGLKTHRQGIWNTMRWHLAAWKEALVPQRQCGWKTSTMSVVLPQGND